MARSRRRRKRFQIRLKWKAVIGILAAVVFIGAFIYYFTSNFIATEREYTVYSTMDEPTLPIIYVISDGGVINPLHGYLQDMGNAAASDLITPLPADRKLKLKIEIYGNNVAGISYEIRSLNLSHFIERTELSDYEVGSDGIYLSLPIQNLINHDTPYLLAIKLDLGENTVNYYTRIIWSDNDYLIEMIETAASFTEKSFDYNEARDLTIYLETDESADNSSLATVGLDSSYSQITWGNTGMRLASTPIISVREFDGIMGAVEVTYFSECENEAGITERYFNTDEFTMRAGSERLYMMDFERKTDRVFDGSKYLFAGNRISLGIVNTENIQTKFSPDRRYIAFKAGRELWLYDQDKEDAVNVFTFRSETDSIRADYEKHDIKILSLGDDGSMDFVLYGYINRGRHEGYNGIVYYRYNAAERTIREIFFMPRAVTYEKIALELGELCVKAGAEMVYIKQDDSIVAIDLTSLEMIDIVSDLTGGRYAISADQSAIAWVEGVHETGNLIRLMDLNTAATRIINAEPGEILSVVSFYGRHLIYGISDADDLWIINKTVRGLPAYSIRIVDSDLNEVLKYEKSGLYFEDIVIEDNRIQITQYLKTGKNEYQFSGKDTVVSSLIEEDLYNAGISSDQSETRKLVHYIDLDKTVRTTRTLSVSAPQNTSIEGAGTVELTPRRGIGGIRYYAYQHGKLKGTTFSLREAIDLIFDEMGWVTDGTSAVVYARADKTGIGVIRDPFNAAQPALMAIENGFSDDAVTDGGYIIMNAADISVNRLLYYVGRGCPVVAYIGADEYCLIYGYTNNSLYIYYPSDDEEESRREEMSLEDAAIYFDRFDNDFIVFRDYPGGA